MWEKVRKYIEVHQMIVENDVVIVGVSGGADSMCLLFVLEKLRKELGFGLVAVHVNHGLRGDAADADERYVQQICEEWEIPLEVVHVDVISYAELHRMSEEEAGRVLRRACFEQVAEKYQGTKIALAHHMDDNAETFLMNLSRGSRLRGLGGMKSVNGSYIRPLLEMRRVEIEAFLENEGIAFCTDESNATDVYTRNRVRAHVLPVLCESVNAGTVEHMNATMKYLRQVQEYLEKQMEILWEDVAEEEEDGIFLRGELWQQEPLLRAMVIHKALTQTSGREKDLEECHVESVDALWEKQSGKQVDLPYRMSACRTYGGIKISTKKAEEQRCLGEIYLPAEEGKSVSVRFGDYVVNCKVFKKTKEHSFVPKKTFTKWFDYDIIDKSVCIRTRKPGDKLVIDHQGNSQKLKKYYINEKIPEKLRGDIPVIAEGDHILWAVGYRQSMAYQVSDKTTTILEIEICGGKEHGRNN